MKKSICIFLLFLCVFLFSSCSLTKTLPDSVTIESHTYTRAFGATLYPLNDSDVEADSTKVSGIHYQKINNIPFDCYVTYDSSAEPHLYFLDDTFDKAVSYYNSLENYNFYCVVGNVHDEEENVKYRITDLDSNMFDKLIEFAKANDYDPHISFCNEERVRYVPISDSDDWTKSEIHFYKESKDEAFSTMKGYTFFIVENRLTLLHYYDFSDEENPQMLIIDVPTELSNYFCELTNNLAQ